MKIGLIGYQASGKSTVFEWLTGVRADPALAHASQAAMATVPDERVEPLTAIYHPKKITLASLELVDTAGLDRKHEGNATRLAVIREAGCLVLVVAAFARAILKEVKGETRERRVMKMLGKGYLEGDQVETLLSDLITDLEGNFSRSGAAAQR